MSEIINAKGLACPEPVILTKKALEAYNDVVALVDNTTAKENISRLASGAGCSVEIADEPDGIFRIHLKKQDGETAGSLTPESCSCDTKVSSAAQGPTVYVIASDTMGRGNDELGSVLMRAFIHTLTELETIPDVMIFYNAGVKLTTEGSDTIDNLKKLEEKGVSMLVCGTCINYFYLTGKIAAGVVSNMYDIAGILSRAGRIIQP